MQVAAELNSLPPSPPVNQQNDKAVAPEVKGKHRIVAELKRFEQETKFLEEELENLEKTDKVSTACQRLTQNVESKPDPLLPVTVGPINAAWERWFEGPRDSPGCRCLIL